jgi:hypothetical protein
MKYGLMQKTNPREMPDSGGEETKPLMNILIFWVGKNFIDE